MQQPTQILQCIRHALQEMRLALVKSAKPIRPQRLQNAYIDIRVEIMQKRVTLDLPKIAGREIPHLLDIKIEQLLTQLRRKIGLRIVEQGSDVVLKCPLAPSLIVEKKRLPISQHHVPRLEIAIHEIIAIRAQQEIRQRIEVVFKRLLIERNPSQPQEIIFEVIQVPRNRLPVKASSRI